MTKIEDILKYAKSLIGIKYTCWMGGPLNKKPHPFYIDDMPTNAYLKKHGTNCTGFINILRQKAGKSVPGSGEWKGGMSGWYDYLKSKKVLKKFDDTKNYELGTLFLRRYRSIEDQGHVAVYINKYNTKTKTKTEGKTENKNKPLYGDIIHSFDFDKNNTGICINRLGWSHFWDEHGFYEYAISPKDWLFSD